LPHYKPPASLIKFLKPYDRAIQKLALDLRALVLEEMAPCHENIYDAYSAVAMGYGPTDRLSDGIFHIAVYAKGVNLGFNHGAALADPAGILEGAGKQIRHIKIRTPSDLERSEIRAYMRRAHQWQLMMHASWAKLHQRFRASCRPSKRFTPGSVGLVRSRGSNCLIPVWEPRQSN